MIGDPLDSLGIEGVGSPEDTRRFLELMKETGLNQDGRLVAQHHPRKEEATEALNEVSGAWGGKPDTCCSCERSTATVPGFGSRSCAGRGSGKRPAFILAFDPDTEAFSFVARRGRGGARLRGRDRALLADGEWRTREGDRSARGTAASRRTTTS